MKYKKNILAIVPARGGSKGIKMKNLKKVSGISLVGHAGICLNHSSLNFIDYKIISTDDPKIAREAKKYDLEVPFFRPKYLSGDRVSDLQVLSHGLKAYEKKIAKKVDIVIMIQPTSPLRKAHHIHKAIKKLHQMNLDSVWSVSEIDLKYNPLKQLKINDDGLQYYDKKGKNIIARQQLGVTYCRNGVVYAFTRDCLLKQKTILGKKSGAIITKSRQISIDTIEDIAIAENLI